MVPSRALLLLIAALALPIPVLTGCGDDSGSSDKTADDDDSKDDSSGEQTDAKVRAMDSSVKSDAGSTSDGSTEEEEDDDAGEQTQEDGGSSSAGDAALDGVDGSLDAKVDAQAEEDASDDSDASKDDAGDEADASTEDAGKEDAGQVDAAVDAGKTDAAVDAGEADAAVDAGKADAATGGFTEADCANADGLVKEQCSANEMKYELVNGKLCCIAPPVSTDGTCGGIQGIVCPDNQFCDHSTYGGGQGCKVSDGLGKCRAIPDADCTGVPPLYYGCGCDNLPHTACDAYKLKTGLEPGLFCQ